MYNVHCTMHMLLYKNLYKFSFFGSSKGNYHQVHLILNFFELQKIKKIIILLNKFFSKLNT